MNTTVLKELVSTTRNSFHQKERFPLKKIPSNEKNDFHWKEWFPLKYVPFLCLYDIPKYNRI